MVDGFSRLYLDHAKKLAPLVRGLKHQIGVPRLRPWTDRHGLLVPWIDRDFEFFLIFRLQQPNNPIVLELLADRPHEDWAQEMLRGVYIRRPCRKSPAQTG